MEKFQVSSQKSFQKLKVVHSIFQETKPTKPKNVLRMPTTTTSKDHSSIHSICFDSVLSLFSSFSSHHAAHHHHHHRKHKSLTFSLAGVTLRLNFDYFSCYLISLKFRNIILPNIREFLTSPPKTLS